MKKTLTILLTLLSTAAFSQPATNAFHGGHKGHHGKKHGAHAVVNTPATTTYSTGTMTATGAITPAPISTQRVRHEVSRNGKFYWRIVECAVPMPGFVAWRTMSRTKVYTSCPHHCKKNHC